MFALSLLVLGALLGHSWGSGLGGCPRLGYMREFNTSRVSWGPRGA